jgi:hypothetical protein
MRGKRGDAGGCGGGAALGVKAAAPVTGAKDWERNAPVHWNKCRWESMHAGQDAAMIRVDLPGLFPFAGFRAFLPVGPPPFPVL